jgi:adenylosuccinate synthase
LGVPTFLSQFFVVNPIAYFQELDKLHALGIEPTVFAHPSCLVTTFADILINQRLEDKRGKDRHGSVGVGFRETVERSNVPELKITLSDLWNRAGSIESKIAEICDKYATFRLGKPIDEPKMIEAFLKGCWAFADAVHPSGIGACKDPVFEGSQGLLLDQNNKQFFPHLTSSNTGMQNVRELWKGEIETYYVSRSYLTRHGAGPLPGEDSKLRYDDATNVDHPYQGSIRFAPLESLSLKSRCAADNGGKPYKLVITHCDQELASCAADFYSHGPTREDIAAGKTPKLLRATA